MHPTLCHLLALCSQAGLSAPKENSARESPDAAFLHILFAKLLTNQGSDTDKEISGEAIRSALRAVKLKPELVEARDLLAGMYARSGQYNLAIEQCRLALRYSPSYQTAIYHLICCVAALLAEWAARRNPNPSKAPLRRATGFTSAGNRQEAIQAGTATTCASAVKRPPATFAMSSVVHLARGTSVINRLRLRRAAPLAPNQS